MSASDVRNESSRGLGQAFSAYLLWGIFPIYFNLLAPAGPAEIIGHRILWSALFCGILVACTGQLRELWKLWRSGRTLGMLALAGVLVSLNWLIYVYAVVSGHVVDASLGYFINPLVTVLLAVLLLGERLRPLQWAAVAVASVAVAVIVIGYGKVPWIALGLALSFGLYGYVKNRVGARVPALVGLTTETMVLAPVALGFLVWLQISGDQHFLGYGAWHAVALMGAGVVTAVPLLLFAGATRRLPLSMVGLIQYCTPVVQFGIGVWLYHEDMPTARWVGFGLVWVALLFFALDSLRAGRAEGRLRRSAGFDR